MIAHLLRKPAHKEPMVLVDHLDITMASGIRGNVRTAPLRQVLLLEENTLNEFDLQPGDLRENIIIDGFELYNLPSGSVIKIGNVLVQLTFLCEPCNRIADKVNLKDIRDKRGILGKFLNDGTIHSNDTISLTGQRMEFIPFEPVERIRWYMNKIDAPIMASELLWQTGLASS
ncbi:MAG TPA: MOSC domain-containing protein, partial [Alphaproteobacteria bacterium]